MDPNKPRPRVMSSLSIPRPRSKTPVTSSIPKPTSTPPTPSKPKPKPAVRPTLTPKSSNPRLAASPNKSSAPSPRKEQKEVLDSPKHALNLKEVIAQKRAEARKLKSTSPTLGKPPVLGDDAGPAVRESPQEEGINDLGRWSLRETIERARSTGAINISSRDLPCIPSALFEIHLGLTPEPLKLVTNESPLPENDSTAARKRTTRDVNWYDAKDLEVIKAWSNKIVELQPELSLFGSLKTLDLNNNLLQSLPESICDLSALTYIDLSHNSLPSLPENFFALPDLTTLKLSHNRLTSLPFNYPFEPANTQRLRQHKGNDFFSPEIRRADKPLPSLRVLEVSFNSLTAAGIDQSIPVSLIKFDLSSNPLGPDTRSLILRCSRLGNLKELLLNKADIDNGAFPDDLFPNASESSPYPQLQLLDLGETKVTETTIRSAFAPTSKVLDFEITNSAREPPEGTVSVTIGKKIVKEAWELEVERSVERRRGRAVPSDSGFIEGGENEASDSKTILKESWEHELPLTEGQRRLAQARAAAHTEESRGVVHPSPVVDEPPHKPDLLKGAWKVEAEEGLTGGAQKLRRAKRTPQQTGASANGQEENGKSPENSDTAQPSHSLATSKYYVADERALTLPPSSAPTKSSTHTRSFSVAHSVTPGSLSDLTVPTPTLPLLYVMDHSFVVATLRVLKLDRRRLDQSFSLPPLTGLPEGGLLPRLEELSFESCGLGDTVPYFEGDDSSSRKSEPLLPLLAKLFPSILTLNLTHNSLTSHGLTTANLSELLLHKATPLRQLELSSNRLTDLEGLVGLAGMFKGNREVQRWKMETLDLRDNEIGKLPAELGLLPLDVFLVEGNTFRIPPRRVWEREGTKGLLSWLRGRLD
ncbi:L domain-like protein [Thelephora ganbajun]|uniref:L domain-like protein n=1 Tax=Thelephora ganbajun TaxID=370292 RepID=A0ACB6ZE12_THEGA|nr:L domain-like protein [Thelephora ganbajun]